MAAPQQQSTPIFHDSYGVPNPQVNYQRMDARDTPGYALANLLGALPDFSKQVQKNQTPDEPSPEEQQQLAALAKIGADETNLRIAKGDNVFGLLKSKDVTMDAYELSRGQVDADLWAGGLRDRYSASGLAENDDPAAFKAFIEKEKATMMANIKDKDNSYYHGFVTRVASAFEEVGVAHAGHLDAFIPAKRKRAAEMDIESKTRLEMAVEKETTAVGQFLKAIGQGEALSYDARHNYASGDGRLKFTEMTLDEVLRWQASGAWKKDGGSSAVGKHQFIRGTLLELVRESGLDPKTTKFTPKVQDQLIMTRLLKTRGLAEYLDGKISVEEFIDGNGLRPDQKGFRGGLKHELASIQGTDGKGQYDGDGKNHAAIPARKAIAAAIALKEAILRDPASPMKKNEKGEWDIDNNAQPDLSQNPQERVRTTLDNIETTHGVSQKEGREYAANALIKMLEADPRNLDRIDLEDKMSDWKLSATQRQKVMEARDRLKSEQEAQGELQERQRLEALSEATTKFLRSGNVADLEAVKSSSLKEYNQLLRLQTNKYEGISLQTPKKTYLEDRDLFNDPEFPSTVLNDYLGGNISKDTYLAAMEQFNTAQAAKPVLELPGVDDYLDTIEKSLPASTQKLFRKTLATSVADLQKRNNGERPTLDEVFDAATALHARLQATSQQKVQSAKDRLTQQDQQEPNG